MGPVKVIKVLAGKADDLSSIPTNHVKWKERTDFSKLSFDLHTQYVAWYVSFPIHINK